MTTTAEQIAAVVASADLGAPSARKAGRDARWPYVPVILVSDTYRVGQTSQNQIKGVAFATRDEAEAYAEGYITGERAVLARKLADPRHRALRESYGLPRELS